MRGSEDPVYVMGRAGDALIARYLVAPCVRNDEISPQSGQAKPSLSLRLWVSLRPMTRAHVTLLGPCFKTGQVDSLPQHHRLSALYRRHKHSSPPNDPEPSPGLLEQATW